MNRCNPQDKMSLEGELLLMDEQREWFFEMGPTPKDNALKTVEMTAKTLEY